MEDRWEEVEEAQAEEDEVLISQGALSIPGSGRCDVSQSGMQRFVLYAKLVRSTMSGIVGPCLSFPVHSFVEPFQPPCAETRCP